MTAQDTPKAGLGSSGEPAAGTSKEVTQQLADALARQGGPARDRAAAGLRELAALDQAVYTAVAVTPTPTLDEPLRRLSNAAAGLRSDSWRAG